MVVAPQPEPVEVGAEVLRSGGNAVDAAVATALTQTVVDPFMCGIAGFGSMHLYLPSIGRHLCLDFHARAPGAVTDGMWADLLEEEAEDGFGFILKGRVNEIGYQAIATPETLRALDTALARFGTRSLADLLRPAIAFARDGYMVRPHMHRFWTQEEPAGRVQHIEYLRGSPATARTYLNADGGLKTPGAVIKNPDMARTLERIAGDGAGDFYEGAIAREIAADMARGGGLISIEDLAACGPEETQPLWTGYRGLRVASCPPPGGGIMVLQMLNILENFDLAGMGHNSPDYIRTVAEAMKIATVDKDRSVGDPRFVDVPVARLLDKGYAADCAARIKAGEVTHVPRVGRDKESKDTTHLCVVDQAGNCVSLTHSLGMPSGVTTDGLGFIYNGCMGVFDPRPGQVGSLAPGKARFTSMAPTILFDGDAPRFIVGAPGGTYIAMGVLQAILNHVDFGMDAQQAVSAPRFSATSDIIEIVNRIPRAVEAELNGRGYRTRRYPINFHFAGVHAIRLMNGVPDGGADPGRDGMAMAV
ncbi:MAG: gamma-glutamyltransferase [Rhodospirillales bacterium CG15_BIG_FIL_POST_REV_8_21_14_020_66_15]|nr:MAG: gamma-glutamyltransferase [Rhodospirillales bacterium CG15_BIG_FIL_POST_REV_8_21_14_020_66_15]